MHPFDDDGDDNFEAMDDVGIVVPLFTAEPFTVTEPETTLFQPSGIWKGPVEVTCGLCRRDFVPPPEGVAILTTRAGHAFPLCLYCVARVVVGEPA